jgi:hypothetical protein
MLGCWLQIVSLDQRVHMVSQPYASTINPAVGVETNLPCILFADVVKGNLKWMK